jgi:hypothetical protein
LQRNLRRRWKLRLFASGTLRTASRNNQPTNGHEASRHYLRNSESSWKADGRIIEEDSRHFAAIIAALRAVGKRNGNEEA